MATKKSLVEVTHDDGYGDSLLMHINSAFGGKDMRADKIVDPVAPAMQIEGIPDAWELVAFRHAVPGDHFLNIRGLPELWSLSVPSSGIYVIIRKIEKPKQYRPFANAAEYMPNWGKPVDWKENDISPCNCAVVCANTTFIWVAFGDKVQRFDWEQAFEKIWFADGTPFGVEVVE